MAESCKYVDLLIIGYFPELGKGIFQQRRGANKPKPQLWWGLQETVSSSGFLYITQSHGCRHASNC